MVGVRLFCARCRFSAGALIAEPPAKHPLASAARQRESGGDATAPRASPDITADGPDNLQLGLRRGSDAGLRATTASTSASRADPSKSSSANHDTRSEGVYCVLSGMVDVMDSSQTELLTTACEGDVVGAYVRQVHVQQPCRCGSVLLRVPACRPVLTHVHASTLQV